MMNKGGTFESDTEQLRENKFSFFGLVPGEGKKGRESLEEGFSRDNIRPVGRLKRPDGQKKKPKNWWAGSCTRANPKVAVSGVPLD